MRLYKYFDRYIKVSNTDCQEKIRIKEKKSGSHVYRKCISNIGSYIYRDFLDREDPSEVPSREEMISDKLVLLHTTRKGLHFIRLSEVKQMFDMIIEKKLYVADVKPILSTVNPVFFFKCPKHSGEPSQCNLYIDIKHFFKNLELCTEFPIGLTDEEEQLYKESDVYHEDCHQVSELISFLKEQIMDIMIQQSKDDYNSNKRAFIWLTRCIEPTCEGHKGFPMTYLEACGFSAICEYCNLHWCTKCNKDHLKHYECEISDNLSDDERLEFQKLVDEGKGQWCPECSFYVELGEGCDKVTCPNMSCKTSFCISCGGKVDPINYLDNHLIFLGENDIKCRRSIIKWAINDEDNWRQKIKELKSGFMLETIQEIIPSLNEQEKRILSQIMVEWVNDIDPDYRLFVTECDILMNDTEDIMFYKEAGWNEETENTLDDFEYAVNFYLQELEGFE